MTGAAAQGDIRGSSDVTSTPGAAYWADRLNLDDYHPDSPALTRGTPFIGWARFLAGDLRLVRRLAGLTQEQAATLAGVSRRQWIRWEQADALAVVGYPGHSLGSIPYWQKPDRLIIGASNRRYLRAIEYLTIRAARAARAARAPEGSADHLEAGWWAEWLERNLQGDLFS